MGGVGKLLEWRSESTVGMATCKCCWNCDLQVLLEWLPASAVWLWKALGMVLLQCSCKGALKVLLECSWKFFSECSWNGALGVLLDGALGIGMVLDRVFRKGVLVGFLEGCS